MAMTVPKSKTIIIECNGVVIYKDNLITFNVGFHKTNEEIIKNLREICASAKGMGYVIQNMDFENAGYNISELNFSIKVNSNKEIIGCSKNGIHKKWIQ